MSKSASLSNHPKELWILAVTELCERFAFWGVGNLLVLYLIESYQFSNVKATHIYGVFAGFSAFLPLVGGWIADRWNYQAPLFAGALINAIGCMLLASEMQSLLFVALAILAFGYGLFTPSILTILGHTYKDKEHLREAGFSIYYASINIGVFLALFSLGSIAKWINWRTAFIVAGTVQLIGLLPLIWYLCKHKASYHVLQEMKRQEHRKSPLTSGDWRKIWVIVIFCLFSLVFWASYIQGFSSMEIFVHQFMNKKIAGMELPEGMFLSSESFFLIVLAPCLAVLYAWLQKRKKDPSPATKTSLSFVFMAGCFLLMMLGSAQIPAGAASASVSSGYLLGAYFLMAVGEMLLAPVGLSMVSLLSPSRFTALLIGFWYVCVGVAFYLGGIIAGWMGKVESLSHFFSLFVFVTLIAAAILFFLSKKLTKMSRIDSHKTDSAPHIPK
ncbi:MAG: peptide MFS transporter [Verrucomicrobia bacterium]|nr:peptide MFS transporter [Verrucomicrobiota bacterium]